MERLELVALANASLAVPPFPLQTLPYPFSLQQVNLILLWALLELGRMQSWEMKLVCGVCEVIDESP